MQVAAVTRLKASLPLSRNTEHFSRAPLSVYEQ